MKKMVRFGFVGIGCLVLVYFLFWPAFPKPVGVLAVTPAPTFSGTYAPNNQLQQIERFGEASCLGPEDIAVDIQGRIYAGMADGRILRLEKDGSRAELVANTGGRPSGLALDQDGNLIVADALKGLLSVSPQGNITLLAHSAGGRPIRLANDLAIDKDGMIYFSDYRYYPDTISDFMDGRPLARLLAYDPHQKTTQVLMDTLYAANGVTLGPADAYVLVNEMTAYRVIRYWLAGPKRGQAEIFIDNLPGYPDNITFNGRDTYWLALFVPRSAAMEYLQARPALRGTLKPLPLLLLTAAANTRSYGWILGLDLEGKVIHNLQDPSGKYARRITSGYEHNGMLYLGNIDDHAIYRLPIP